MVKKLGPVMVDTNPPYRPWDGNQATMLFFPVFFSFILVLLSGLSDPLIAGLSIVDIDTNGNGTVGFGSWGWCATGNPNTPDTCSPHRAFSDSMQVPTDHLPAEVASLAEVAKILPASYLQTAGIFHIFAIIATWLTLTWTLASSGAWNNKDPKAWGWTRWSFAGTLWSSLLIVIAWGLELGEVTRIQAKITNIDGSQPTVTPGPAIWMMMVALILNLAAFATRITLGKYKTRPEWTTKETGTFKRNEMPPHSAALPPSDDLPPTWESLSLATGSKDYGDDKKEMQAAEVGNAV